MLLGTCPTKPQSERLRYASLLSRSNPSLGSGIPRKSLFARLRKRSDVSSKRSELRLPEMVRSARSSETTTWASGVPASPHVMPCQVQQSELACQEGSSESALSKRKPFLRRRRAPLSSWRHRPSPSLLTTTMMMAATRTSQPGEGSCRGCEDNSKAWLRLQLVEESAIVIVLSFWIIRCLPKHYTPTPALSVRRGVKPRFARWTNTSSVNAVSAFPLLMNWTYAHVL